MPVAPLSLSDTPNPEVIAYFTQWSQEALGYGVKDVVASGAAERITVINYAFGHLDRRGRCLMLTKPGVMDAYADYVRPFSAEESVDGVADAPGQPLRGNFNQLRKLKARYPHLRVVISLGGWLWSEGFSDAALSEDSRRRSVESCIDVYLKGNLPLAEDGAGGPGAAAGVFDGIDVDWEYVAAPGHPHNTWRPWDTANFTLLLAEFRRQLDELGAQTGRRYLLTVATPAPTRLAAKMELGKIHNHLDWINLMTYDFHGTWERLTNFHAPLFGSPDAPLSYPRDDIDSSVRFYLDAGVPAGKLVLGVPFYGRGWTGVQDQDNGLFQPAAGPAKGSYEDGYEGFRNLQALDWPSFRDPHTGSSWIFDGSTFWSYDDPSVIAAKMQYARQHGLRGAMVWSLDGDDAQGMLMKTLHTSLTNPE